jgi:cell division protease FtsH
MFTIQTQKIIDQAKRDARAKGFDELAIDILLAAVQQGEGSILMSHLAGVKVEWLKERFPPIDFHGSFLSGPIGITNDVHQVIAQAHKFAQQVPDRTHPGLIALRHLACALFTSQKVVDLFGVSLLSETDALKQLQAWDESDEGTPLLGDLSGRLRALRTELLDKVYGQDHAVQAFIEGLFNAELLARADDKRKKPQALFVFAGPPGVGKTFLAELGAEALNRPFKRFDMSSFSDHQQYMELVGFAPSYQAAKPGNLTGFAAENPNAIFLFDEIEKAHLTTIHLFLQILDAGRLEDKFTSQTVSFKDTIIIFTTNSGASLYDRPNQTGITTANSSFHRRTILDALKTEKTHTGQPAFPAAICSRMATGYPILFNHLGINELERIARAEINRVIKLLERQYYKVIAFDDFLPLALVLREGANLDARTLRAQSGTFIQSELFKLTELYTPRRLERSWKNIDTVLFSFEMDKTSDSHLTNIIKQNHRPKVMLLSNPELVELYTAEVKEVDWLLAADTQTAMQLLAGEDVDMVLLDIWIGRPVPGNIASTSVSGFDFVPLGARALAEGQALLRALHERLPGVPVYILSLVQPGSEAGSVDEGLLQACIFNGGARGLFTTAFTNTQTSHWEDERDQFVRRIFEISNHLAREKSVRALVQERKVVNFETTPAIDRVQRQITIRLRNLRLTQAIESSDVGEVVENIERPNICFADVFGADSAKEALQFVVEWLREPRRYAALGVRPPRGILLTGLPGTGKTMLARALAGESDVAFLVASGTDFVTIWQGSGPQNIRDLFARARRYAPAIVFIDEIDAIGKKRMGLGGGNRSEESTLNALLTEMDGFGGPTLRPVIVLSATNLASQLDEALLRRFDREIEVLPPDRPARAAFLAHELLDRSFSLVTLPTVESIAARSAGLTISDLKRITNEAAIMAARCASQLTDQILEEAFEKVRMGEASKAPDPVTLERIARHEAGHALIGWYMGIPVAQITIVGRGSAGGYVEPEAQEEKIIYTRKDLEAMICQAMGGRAAEILYYGEEEGLSTGLASDLRQASAWARRMIREFGMSEEVGLIYIDEQSLREGQIAAQVNSAAEKIVHAQLDRAIDLLTTHRLHIDALSTELLARNRLLKKDLERIVATQ